MSINLDDFKKANGCRQNIKFISRNSKKIKNYTTIIRYDIKFKRIKRFF